MRRSFSPVFAFARRFWRAKRGMTAITVALMFTTIVGFSGYVIDVGHVLYVQRSLQASTDAAALAGAHDINCCSGAPGTAVTTANSYSSVAGKKNAIGGLSVTMASGFPKLKCLASTGVSCTGSDSANAIQVKQTASVPMWFAQIFGVSTMAVTTTSTAGANAGSAKPLDIMIVVDTTYSMNTADSSCSIAGASRVTCALAGVRTLLNSLAPSGDSIGLMAFPGLTNASQAQYDYACNSNPAPAIASYRNSPVYQVTPLANDFKTSNKATSLNASSNLVLAAQGGPTSCNQGMRAIGGYGTFYGDIITSAQTALTNNGRTGVQKVIILLSDGDANAQTGNMPTGKALNQCHEAITAAQNAASAGTWVYAIAYGADTSSTSSCSTDSPHISACSTMQQIASDPKFFFSDTTGGSSSCTSAANSVSELVALFQSIGASFQSPRLLPDNTT